MNRLFTSRLLMLAASLTFNPIAAFAVDKASDNMILVAQNKKVKKRGSTANKKKSADPTEAGGATEGSTEGSELVAETPSETDNASQYVYRDTLGGAPALYNVDYAKVTKREVAFAFNYFSFNSKSSSDVSSNSLTMSGPRLYGVATVPFSKLFSAGGGFDYLSIDAKSNYSSDYGSGSSKSTISNLSVPLYVAAHLTPSFDAGIRMDYYVTDSVKNETYTTNYSYMTLKPSVGVHGKKYEASFSYQPLVKAKGKLTSGNSESSSSQPTGSADSEKELASKMILSGRFLAAPKIFAGGGYESDSQKNSHTNIIALEVGMNGSGFQVAAGLELNTETTKSESTDKSTTETKNSFVIEAVSIDKTKQPRFSAMFSYAPTSEKSEGSTTNGSIMIIGAGAQLHF